MGNAFASSAKNLQLFESRNLTVEQYIAKFRKGGIKEVLPTDAKNLTVEEALRSGRVGDVNVRKLILDTRDKFVK